MIEWKQFNLLDDMGGLGVFDLVFCRNVLIYFDQATKSGILRRVRERLRPGGYLFLGLSETTLNVDESYERLTVGSAIVYRTPTHTSDSEGIHGRRA